MSFIFTPNAYLGLFQGPIDKASSVVNAILSSTARFPLPIGFPVFILSSPSSELLPRVDAISRSSQIPSFYGIAVGGDNDGLYPIAGSGFIDAHIPANESTIVADLNEGLRVCTKGRCVAQVVAIVSEINVGDPLAVISTSRALGVATSGDFVVARSLQFVAQTMVEIHESYAVVDIQREGILP